MASSEDPAMKEPTEDTKEEGAQAIVPVPLADDHIKHPLQNKWALWFFKNDKSKTWAANLRLITKFDTWKQVEEFWGVYNHIQAASKLQTGCDYSLFKDGIEPMWEDERNKRGGRWLINTDKKQRQNELDRIWMETLLCLIGEAFDEFSEDVCGAVVQIRNKGDKLAIWTGNALSSDSVLAIGRTFKERLNLPAKFNIGYQAHEDTMSKTGSTTKSKFSL